MKLSGKKHPPTHPHSKNTQEEESPNRDDYRDIDDAAVQTKMLLKMLQEQEMDEGMQLSQYSWLIIGSATNRWVRLARISSNKSEWPVIEESMII